MTEVFQTKLVAPRPVFEESRQQRSLVKWWRLAHRGLGVPDERLLFSVPNGAQRHRVNSAILLAEGLRAGAPDLILAVARGGFHALAIEMKTATGVVSRAQAEMHALLRAQGYCVVVPRSFDAARRDIERYLAIPRL